MVLLIIIPFLNGYFIGNINPTFSDKHIYILDPHVNSHRVVFDFGGQLGFGNAQVVDSVVLPRTLTLLDNPVMAPVLFGGPYPLVN